VDFKQIKHNLASTPAYIFDENVILNNLTELVDLKKQSGCRVLYSIKALPLKKVLELAKNNLDGLSVSSLYEAQLASEVLKGSGSIHITTPGLRDNEYQQITELCSHISFNSISQYQRLQAKTSPSPSLGFRVNPKLSFSKDLRFDPCRPYSKLGVPIDALTTIPDNIQGLHVHTVFSNTHYEALEKTVSLLEKKLDQTLNHLKWLNLGGGYLYHHINNHQPFIGLIKRLKSNYPLDIFIEPGKAIVGNAGYLVTEVIDCFISDNKHIVVLDTSVNHNPEVFEYQKSPELIESNEQGEISCLLVGSSCLAGDIFGEYSLKKSPKVGDRLVFKNVGAYSLIKANRFNGYNLPDIYWLDKNNTVSLLKQSDYQDYRKQW